MSTCVKYGKPKAHKPYNHGYPILIKDIHNSIMDMHNSIMDIHNSIMDIHHDSIMEIHDYGYP